MEKLSTVSILGNPNNNRIPDPIANHVSDTADMVRTTSGQPNGWNLHALKP